jgi:type VI protein secretion system component VasK
LIAERSDLILAAAVVFAEGSWRARHGWVFTGPSKQLIGLLGAVVSTVLLVFVLLVEVEQVDRLAAHIKSNLFITTQHLMVGLSLLYGLWVRVAAKAEEDLHRRYEQEARDELDAMRAAQGLPSWSRRFEEEIKQLEVQINSSE